MAMVVSTTVPVTTTGPYLPVVRSMKLQLLVVHLWPRHVANLDILDRAQA